MKLALIGITVLGVLTLDVAAQRGGFGRGNMTQVWEHLAARYDKNKDGKISREEYPRGQEKFDSWDGDGDGAITRADLENRGRRSRGNRGNRGNPGNRGNRRRPGPGMGDGFFLGRLVARSADHDGDDKVTAREWAAFVQKLDRDEDGNVSADELKLSRRRFRLVRPAMDADRDGRVQVQELEAVFRKLDRDNNQELAAREMGINRRGGLRGNEAGVPRPGQVAPDFELPLAQQPEAARQEVTIKLSSFAGRKPVALIFGSYT